MGKIVLVMGPAYSGKYEIVKNLLNEETFSLRKIIRCTTRSPRPDEIEGKEYYFKTIEQYLKEKESGTIVESQEFTVKTNPIYVYTSSNDIDLSQHNYITVGNMLMFDQLIKFYGPERIISILTQMDRDDRLQTGLNYQRTQATPDYQTLCRTFIDESNEYSKENIESKDITGIVNYNVDKEQMVNETKLILSKHL